MLASSFLDPVLGLDIHFELTPLTGPAPVPIPNPFIGLVFDPIGLVAGLALDALVSAVVGAPVLGPVLYWTAFPATNTGTEAKHVTGHILIPPGTAWAPFPKMIKPTIHPNETPKPALPIKPENDAVVITGSKTVKVMGTNAARLGDIALSCSEPLRLPSSVVLAIPKGAPILIGGPPALDLAAAFLASLRTRFVSDTLHALLSRMKPSRLRNVFSRVVCFFTGHPVDVASGKVMTEFVDVELPGPLPLKIERIYSSAFAARPGPLGHGWSLSVDQGLWRERGKVVLLAEDGREIEFDTFDLPGHRIEPGQRLYHTIERLTLHCEDDGRWRIVAPDGSSRLFAPIAECRDGRARLKCIISACERHMIGFHYDVRGALASIRDSGGRTIRLAYDESNRLSEILLPRPSGDGHQCCRRYRYDGDGDLVEVRDALGHAWSFAYVTHLLTQETDRNGLSFYFAYDGLGEDAWCVRTWGDGGIYDHVLAYDKQKRVTFVTNSLGYTTQYQMNLIGQVVKVVDPLGGEANYSYDAKNLQRVKRVNAAGEIEAWRHDDHGNTVEFIAADGARIQWEFNDHAAPLTAIDTNGGRWRWRYDEHHCLRSAEDPCGAVTQYSYESGLLVAVNTTGGSAVEIRRDDQGNVSEIKSPDGGLRTWHHDRLGNILSVEDPSGARQTRRIDAEGRVSEVREDDGIWRRYEYDAEGQVVEAKDHSNIVKFRYCGRGRLVAHEEAGQSLRFEYDTEGHLTAIVNLQGRRHRFVRDARGEIIQEVGFDGAEQRFCRDRAGRLVRHTKPSGRVVSRRRDLCGRVVEIDHGGGTVEEFSYRADGLLVEAKNDYCVVQLERDLVGRILREQQADHWVESRYNHDGARIRARSSLGGDLWLSRDKTGDGYTVEQSVPSGVPGQPTRWRAKRRTELGGTVNSWELPGGLLRRWRFNRRGQPEVHSVHSGSKPVIEERYEFAKNGRLIRRSDRAGNETSYERDRTGNLLCARHSDGTEVGHHSDVAGNLYRLTDLSDRCYDEDGRVVTLKDRSGATLHRRYDADGFLVRQDGPDGTWTYKWDTGGRLIEVSPPQGETVQFRYDALGRRVSKQQGERSTRWVWDGLNLHHELQEPGGEVVTWVFAPESLTPIAKLMGTVALSVVGDHLGAPLAMLDEKGAFAWRGSLNIWGEMDVEVGARSDCPLRWPGQYDDVETGLYYNRFRYYDPTAGSYISSDPLRRLGGLSSYGYAADSTIWVDPFGLIVLYHYTDLEGLNGILESNEIWPSTEPKNTKFGVGQYFSDVPPSRVAGRTLKDLTAADKAAGKISLGQLSVFFYNDTRRVGSITHFVAVDLDDSLVEFCRDGTYVVKGSGDLDVKGKITDSGATC